MIKDIKNQLNKDIVQRLMYGLGLVFWTFLMWDRITSSPQSTSSIGLNYSTVYFIPTIILTLQIILNNRLLWGLIFGSVTIYIIVTFYLVIADSIERSGNHVKAIDWSMKDFLLLLLFFGLTILTDVLIYNIKPKRLV